MGATKPAKHLKTGPAPVSLSSDKGLDKGEPAQVEFVRDDGVSNTLAGDDVPLPPPSPSSIARGETNRSGGVIPPSPFGDTFDPEEFIKSNFVLEGNLDKFDSMGYRISGGWRWDMSSRASC
jgi:hypothetical protein